MVVKFSDLCYKSGESPEQYWKRIYSIAFRSICINEAVKSAVLCHSNFIQDIGNIIITGGFYIPPIQELLRLKK